MAVCDKIGRGLTVNTILGYFDISSMSNNETCVYYSNKSQIIYLRHIGWNICAWHLTEDKCQAWAPVHVAQYSTFLRESFYITLSDPDVIDKVAEFMRNSFDKCERSKPL